MLFKSDHFFQNEGRNRIKIANNSNLPNIIPILNTHLDKSGKLEKYSPAMFSSWQEREIELTNCQLIWRLKGVFKGALNFDLYWCSV